MKNAEGPYIDPQMKLILDRIEAAIAARPAVQSTPEQMRAGFAADVARWNRDPVSLPRVEDKTAVGAFGPARVRLYDPTGSARPKPALIYFHGGGWVVGSPDTGDAATRLLAKKSGVVILSIDYALAPEHKFPGPLDDCVAVSRWLRENAGDWGIDTDHLAIGGESAGANLALSTAITLRDAGENWLCFGLLLYGVFSADHETESHRLFGRGGYGFGSDAMEMLWALYLEDAGQKLDPRAAPLFADLAGLPSLYLVAGGLDPLRDDTRNLARRLEEAGTAHLVQEYAGVTHGFMSMVGELDIAVDATEAAAAALSRVLVQN